MNRYWPAPAKINLFLHITSVRKDGYHQLQTLFQFLDWCDYLSFDVNKSGVIDFTCDNAKLNNQSNLVVKAAKLLQKNSKCRLGVSIKLQKNLPSGAGLGGGSSDAATTLVALNTLWQCGLSQQALQNLGVQLGADVPIFIYGKTCWAEGIGEEFYPLQKNQPDQAPYLCVKPKQSINTAKLFASPVLKRNCAQQNKDNFNYANLSNVFQAVVEQKYPEIIKNIENIYQQLKHQGVDEKGGFLGVPYRMTGSGSVFYLPIKKQVTAHQIKIDLAKGYTSRLCYSQNVSLLNKFIQN